MRPLVSMTLGACALAALGSSALAQTPPPAAPPAPPAAGGTPDAMPFDIPYGVSIGLEKAKQVMAAAEAEAKRRNWKMDIAIVDTNGELVHFSRMEGAQIGSVNVSIGKARTSARFRRGHYLLRFLQSDRHAVGNIERRRIRRSARGGLSRRCCRCRRLREGRRAERGNGAGRKGH